MDPARDGGRGRSRERGRAEDHRAGIQRSAAAATGPRARNARPELRSGDVRFSRAPPGAARGHGLAAPHDAARGAESSHRFRRDARRDDDGHPRLSGGREILQRPLRRGASQRENERRGVRFGLAPRSPDAAAHRRSGRLRTRIEGGLPPVRAVARAAARDRRVPGSSRRAARAVQDHGRRNPRVLRRQSGALPGARGGGRRIPGAEHRHPDRLGAGRRGRDQSR